MEYVGKTFRHEPKISGLTPDEQIEAGVEQFPTRIGRGIPDPNVRFPPKVGAPRRVVAQQLPSETPEHSGVQRVDVVRRRLKPHLGVRKVEHQVLSLVPDVVSLEAEEKAEPVEEVHVVVPRPERRLPEVPDGA